MDKSSLDLADLRHEWSDLIHFFKGIRDSKSMHVSERVEVARLMMESMRLYYSLLMASEMETEIRQTQKMVAHLRREQERDDD